MLIADLYIRVSTEEQANKGYSLKYQEEALRAYCTIKDISINKIVVEDFSAKSFKRPEWLKWLDNVRLHKHQKISLLLFTKWDRFSRNAGDAYYMISVLQKFGIEPYAIEQPLDMSVPENKMMLAFYLAIPEVENARRALNIKQGIRKAKKEGRWIGTAPIGYVNKIMESGIKYISPSEPQATMMRTAFRFLSEGNYNIHQIYLLLTDEGLRISESAFRRAIKNPVYCGKVFIPAFDNEEAFHVQGLHEPLVSVELFTRVHNLYSQEHYKKQDRKTINDNFPLRGFLICPLCGKVLTASKSLSKLKKYYYYYHCSGKCKARYRVESIHAALTQELKNYTPIPGFIDFFRVIIHGILSERLQSKADSQQILMQRINEAIFKIHKAEELLLSGSICGSDYQRIKKDGEMQISILGEQVIITKTNTNKIDKYTRKAASYLGNLSDLYSLLNTIGQRGLLDSLFKNKIVFDIGGFKSAELSVAGRIIYGRKLAFV